MSPRQTNVPVTALAVASVTAALGFIPTAVAQCESNWSVVGQDEPTPRQNHGMVFDSQRGVVVLFGG
jgi:hypothetical protein